MTLPATANDAQISLWRAHVRQEVGHQADHARKMLDHYGIAHRVEDEPPATKPDWV
jgi:hypothetical protein